MSAESELPEIESVNGGELVYRVSDPDAMRLRDDNGAAPVLEGRMMPYNEWTEVNSSIEGHFMERFAPGSLAKTITERARHIRVLFEHGLDSAFGRQAIADIDEMRDEEDGAWYRSTLLDGLPPLMIAGLRRGLYGSSVRYAPVKWDRVRSPKPSETNPKGIPEHTIREAYIREVSVVTFPQYAGATAGVRSLTDEIAAMQFRGNPERLLELLQRSTPLAGRDEPADGPEHEPQHSDREEPETQAPERSRRTQPPDYLKTTEEEAWRL